MQLTCMGALTIAMLGSIVCSNVLEQVTTLVGYKIEFFKYMLLVLLHILMSHMQLIIQNIYVIL